MNILGLISSPADPASRARILQYIPYFKEKGSSLACKHYNPLREADPPGWSYRLKKITGINEWRSADLLKSAGRIPLLFNQSGYDAIWQNRLIQLQHLFWEKRLRKPVAFDFDDAIWINEGKNQVQRKIEMSQMIFAGNSFLAEYAAAYNKKVQVVPTTVDTNIIRPSGHAGSKFTIGWAGTHNNQLQLDLVKNVLTEFIRLNPGSRLIVVSDKPYGNISFDNETFIFKQWSPEKENELLNEFSIGIMPLEDNEWNRGKCSYKMLQYMACGKPVIVSPVGKNKEILSEAETGFGPENEQAWLRSLQHLKNDQALYAAYSGNALKLVQEKYSASVWTPLLLQYLEELI